MTHTVVSHWAPELLIQNDVSPQQSRMKCGYCQDICSQSPLSDLLPPANCFSFYTYVNVILLD